MDDGLSTKRIHNYHVTHRVNRYIFYGNHHCMGYDFMRLKLKIELRGMDNEYHGKML